jgi:hypothetical protein
MSQEDGARPDGISEEEETLVARLACEYFEQARDGKNPDEAVYLAQLPNDLCREYFRLSVGMSLTMSTALKPEH